MAWPWAAAVVVLRYDSLSQSLPRLLPKGLQVCGLSCKCKHMTAVTFNASGKEGFFQLPRQIASAMVHVGRLGVRSYLELGVYSG